MKECFLLVFCGAEASVCLLMLGSLTRLGGGVYISTLSGILVKHEVVNIENMYVFEL